MKQKSLTMKLESTIETINTVKVEQHRETIVKLLKSIREWKDGERDNND